MGCSSWVSGFGVCKVQGLGVEHLGLGYRVRLLGSEINI